MGCLFVQIKKMTQELDLYRQVILFCQYCRLTKCIDKL